MADWAGCAWQSAGLGYRLAMAPFVGHEGDRGRVGRWDGLDGRRAGPGHAVAMRGHSNITISNPAK